MFGELRIHLGTEIFEIELGDRQPGLAQVLERLLQDHVHHAHLGGRKLAPLDLGVEPAVAAEEIVHHDEHELWGRARPGRCRATV